MAQLKLSLEALDRSLAASSLAEFVWQAWPLIKPPTPLQWNWHLDVICEYPEAVAGGDIRRLLINVPPRSGKMPWPRVILSAKGRFAGSMRRSAHGSTTRRPGAWS
jgi:hypothetical protein